MESFDNRYTSQVDFNVTYFNAGADPGGGGGGGAHPARPPLNLEKI